jgi:hypothetical protein
VGIDLKPPPLRVWLMTALLLAAVISIAAIARLVFDVLI